MKTIAIMTRPEEDFLADDSKTLEMIARLEYGDNIRLMRPLDEPLAPMPDVNGGYDLVTWAKRAADRADAVFIGAREGCSELTNMIAREVAAMHSNARVESFDENNGGVFYVTGVAEDGDHHFEVRVYQVREESFLESREVEKVGVPTIDHLMDPRVDLFDGMEATMLNRGWIITSHIRHKRTLPGERGASAEFNIEPAE